MNVWLLLWQLHDDSVTLLVEGFHVWLEGCWMRIRIREVCVDMLQQCRREIDLNEDTSDFCIERAFAIWLRGRRAGLDFLNSTDNTFGMFSQVDVDDGAQRNMI